MHITVIGPIQDQRPEHATSIIDRSWAPHSATEPAILCKRKPGRSGGGFTLIELMITLAVAGVLSSVALPSFEQQLQKARRADVLVPMMQIQAAQERFRANGMNYGSLAEIGVPRLSPAGHYALQTTVASANGYEVLAMAIGIQARDADCRYMKLAATGLNLVYASGPDASVANPASTNRRCWYL